MNYQSDEKIAHLHKIIDTTREIDRLIISENDPEVIVKRTCEILVNTRGYYIAWIALFDNGQQIKYFTGFGETALINSIKNKLTRNGIPGQFWQTITSSDEKILKELSPDCPINLDKNKWTPFTTLIKDKSRVHGVLCAAIPSNDAYHPKEEQSFIDLSNNIGFALTKKAQEHKLKNSELHYKNLVNSLNDGLLILQDGVMKFVSKSLCQIFGYTEEELLGNQFMMLVAPNELDRVKQLYVDLLAGNITYKHYDSSGITKSGKTFSVEITAANTIYNDRHAYMVILHDNSELKKSLEQLKESEEYFKFLSNASFEGILIHDDGIVLEVNETLLRLTGYSREDFIGKSLFRDFETEVVDTKVIGNLGKEMSKSHIISGTKKDGTIVHIELESRNITYKGKQVRIAAIRDITDRHELQEEIKDNREKLNRLLDNLPGVAYTCKNDKNWSMNFMSQGCFLLFGYQPEELMEEGTLSYIDLIHRKDREYVWETIQTAIHKNEIYEVEYRVITKQNKVKWVWERGKAIYSDNELVLEGFISDITQRKKLERSNEMLSKAVEASPVSIFITDVNGNIEYVNPYFEEITGYSSEEILGQNPKFLKSGEHSLAFYKELWSTIKTGNIWHGEIRNRKKSGELYWEQAIISPIFSKQGKITQFVAVREDITEMKNALKELQKAKETAEHNEKRFKALHNASFGGIAIHDKGKILDCNQGLAKISGFSHEELVGMDGLLLIDEEYRKEVLQNILRDYRKPYEVIGLRKNGQKYHLRLEGAMIPYAGKIARVVEFRDISKQKEIEKELILAKEKAEQSDKLKSSFLANMSHEIRTPMNGILGFTELLKEPELSIDQRTEFIDVIQTSGERMLNTINDIIDISKIESGIVNVVMQDINLSSLINDLFVFFDPQMQKKGIEFRLNENNGSPVGLFYTDPDKLNSILTNLIKNAYKFTSSGYVEFGYKTKDNFIHFYVNDSGVGIPKDRHEAIFDRFVQADIADSRVFEGSGLGLSITKSYTEMLNGSISLKSNIGEGTSFLISLPIPTPAHNTQNGENSNQPNGDYLVGQKLKILIAEDDPVSIALLKLLVKEFASEISVAKNGKEIIQLAKDNPDADLILMDIKMPILDGYSATSSIREFNKSVKIIAQSAFAQREDKEKAIKAGCDNFVSKPINKARFLEVVKDLFVAKP